MAVGGFDGEVHVNAGDIFGEDGGAGAGADGEELGGKVGEYIEGLRGSWVRIYLLQDG